MLDPLMVDRSEIIRNLRFSSSTIFPLLLALSNIIIYSIYWNRFSDKLIGVPMVIVSVIMTIKLDKVVLTSNNEIMVRVLCVVVGLCVISFLFFDRSYYVSDDSVPFLMTRLSNYLFLTLSMSNNLITRSNSFSELQEKLSYVTVIMNGQNEDMREQREIDKIDLERIRDFYLNLSLKPILLWALSFTFIILYISIIKSISMYSLILFILVDLELAIWISELTIINRRLDHLSREYRINFIIEKKIFFLFKNLKIELSKVIFGLTASVTLSIWKAYWGKSFNS